MSQDVLDSLASVPPPAPPPIASALETELASLAAVAPRRPVRQLMVLVAVSLAYAGALLAVRHTRVDLDELPVSWLVVAGLVWLVGFVVPCAVALVPHADSMLPRWRAAAALAVVASIALPVMGLVVHPHGPSSWHLGWAQFLDGRNCLLWGLITAGVPAAVSAWCLRGALPVNSRWTFAAVGASAGSLGGLLLHLHCPIADGPHIGLIHGGTVAVAALLAAVIGPRVADRPLR